MKTVHAKHHATLAEIPQGWYVIDVSIGPCGEVTRLVAEGPPPYAQPAWGTDGQNYEYYPLHIYHQAETEEQVVALAGANTRQGWTSAHLLGANQWFLTTQPSNNRERKRGRTGWIYGPDGEPIHAFHAGDRIEDVLTTSDARIWISFGDDGVFGESRVSHSGVACFDGTGRLIYGHRDHSVARGLPFFAQCYAMNVTPDENVWLYTYTDFPLVHIHDGSIVEWWPDMPVHGSHAFAVGDNRVLLAGSYDRKSSLYLVDLNTREVDEVLAVDAENQPITFGAGWPPIGRGPLLYFFFGSGVLTVNTEEL